MREQSREKQPEPVRRQVPQDGGCLDVLIHQHGHEQISTLAQLFSLTNSVENSLEHTMSRH